MMKRYWFSIRRPNISSVMSATRSCPPLEAWPSMSSKSTRKLSPRYQMQSLIESQRRLIFLAWREFLLIYWLLMTKNMMMKSLQRQPRWKFLPLDLEGLGWDHQQFICLPNQHILQCLLCILHHLFQYVLHRGMFHHLHLSPGPQHNLLYLGNLH